MITPLVFHRSIAPRWLSRVQLIAIALSLSPLAGPGWAEVGHWTPKSYWSEGEQARYAVHMMLLRGDATYHSRILWFQGENVAGDTLYGGEWGWTPGGDDYSQFPTSHFVRLGLNHSGMNPFCAGHAMLGGAGDDRVLVAGGYDPNVQEYGEIRARIFTDGTGDARGTWTPVPDMHYRRFYPTLTTLRDGRVMATAGSQHRQHRIFGGLASGDTLRRFAPTSFGRWDPPVIPDPYGGQRPTPRVGHTAVEMEYVQPFGAHVYFGGKDVDGPKKDTWFQRFSFYDNLLAGDSHYSWFKPTITGDLPPERTDHSAVVALGNSMVVYGGLSPADTARSDVWRFYFEPLENKYHWNRITKIGGTTPTARFGHSAIFDTTVILTGDTLRRMIVFGGAEAPNQDPTDLGVWELRFHQNYPDSATWFNLTRVDLSPGVTDEPGPRFWHTLNGDNAGRARNAGTPACHTAFLYGGRLDSSTCSDSLWKLWIFRDGTVGWEHHDPGGDDPPGPRARHSTVLDPHQSGYSARIYVYGGTRGNGDPAGSRVYVLDPWGGQYTSWSQWSDLGVSLAGHTAVLDHDPQQVRTAEVFSPVDTLWHEQSSATLWQQFYPPVFLVPGGGGSSRVINVGDYGRRTYWLDVPPAGQSPTESWVELPNGSTGYAAYTGVQYRPGRIMTAGGRNLNRYVTGLTKTLNASILNSSWVTADSLIPRQNPNLVLLPTGNVLAVGGNQSGVSGGPIKRPQMWTLTTDSTGVWSGATDLAEQPTIRPNHSTAILLPDGRVLSAGGDGAQGDTSSDQHTADIFYPPYLFQSDGSTLAERPSFSNSAKPESLGYGKVFTICVPDTAGITRAGLIRPGATTHAVDMNQRYVPLLFTRASNPMRLLATSPASPDSAPPGDYMLFLTGKGSYPDVPSIAKWVRVVAAGLDSCDQVAPAIGDVFADCDPNVTNGWILSWVAPGDDGTLGESGRAAYFDMRSRSVSITSSNWRGATHINTPAPGPATTVHTAPLTVSGTRYIRMATRDDNNNPAADSTSLSEEVSVFPWTTQGLDCYGGEGMMGGGGGGGGYSAGRAPGFAVVRSAKEATVAENSLVPGARAGEKSHDALRVARGLVSVGASYTAQIRERAGRAATLDQVRLVAVDRPAELEAVSIGGRFALGTLRPALSVSTADGSDAAASLNAGTSYTAAPGETLTVDLGPGGGGSPILIEAAGAWPCAVDVLGPGPNGGWQSLGRLQPRKGMETLGLTPPGSDIVKLAAVGKVSLQFVGSLTTSGETATVGTAALVRADGSRLGEVTSLVSGSDDLGAALVGPDTLALAFEAPPLEAGKVRDYFLAVEATPVSGTSLAALQRAVGAPSVPTRFALRQNRPNPFNATTTVWFDLPVGAMVRLEVFDPQGRRIQTLANRYFPPGSHAVPWNPSSGGRRSGRRIGPGVYFYRIEAGAFHDRKKMTLIP